MPKDNKALVPSIAINPTSTSETDILPPELMQQLENKLPEWVKELARDGTAVLRWNLELVILLESILQHDFGMGEKDLVAIEKRLKELLPIAHKLRLEEPRQLRKQDFLPALENIDDHKKLIDREKSVLSMPSKEEIKRLGKK